MSIVADSENAWDYLSLVQVNEDDTTDPMVLLGIAQVLALIEITDAIKSLTSEIKDSNRPGR